MAEVIEIFGVKFRCSKDIPPGTVYFFSLPEEPVHSLEELGKYCVVIKNIELPRGRVRKFLSHIWSCLRKVFH